MAALDIKPREAEDRTGEYQAVCGWAIAAFVLGLFSVAALAAPVLWVVPVAGVSCAAVAMWRIKRSRGELIGWNLSLLGLALALIFGVAAPTHIVTRWMWLKQRAEVAGKQYIDLLQKNQPYAAHQLTLSEGMRQKSLDDAPAAYAADQKLLDRYNNFLKHEPAKSLLDHGGEAKVDLVSSSMLTSSEGADDIGLHYRISYPLDGTTKSIDVGVVLRRTLDAHTQREEWFVLRSNAIEETVTE
jgi:hypothetical protein